MNESRRALRGTKDGCPGSSLVIKGRYRDIVQTGTVEYTMLFGEFVDDRTDGHTLREAHQLLDGLFAGVPFLECLIDGGHGVVSSERGNRAEYEEVDGLARRSNQPFQRASANPIPRAIGFSRNCIAAARREKINGHPRVILEKPRLRKRLDILAIYIRIIPTGLSNELLIPTTQSQGLINKPPPRERHGALSAIKVQPGAVQRPMGRFQPLPALPISAQVENCGNTR